MSAAKQNLVLGSGTGDSAEQLLPFVSSLRGAGYEGEVALVVHPDQLESLSVLAGGFAVTLVPVARLPRRGLRSRLQNRGRMRWVHRALESILPPLLRHPRVLDHLGMSLQHFFHIACGRYFVYYSYLYPRRHSYLAVLLTDVRDVIFQGDPFHYANGAALCCFMDPAVRLGDEPVNTEWVTTTFGAAWCASRRGKRIACSGTTMGDIDSILGYLQEMCIEMARALPRIAGLLGVDQAVHNYLLWEDRLPGALLCENGRHAVMTLKNADIGALRRDGAGRLLNGDGNPAPVLHQYDFHPALVSRINPR
jgi:hypothetical protein